MAWGGQIACSAAAQVTRHVAPCGNDAWTGLSASCAAPNGPKRTIQAAINASAGGDTVLVENGTYTGPGNRNLDFAGRIITLRSRNGSAACVLDVEATTAAPARAFHLRSGETRVARIEGFTITRGLMTYDVGGAMLLEGASPTVSNCVFKANGNQGAIPPLSGGAVASLGGDPFFDLCVFENNCADFDGLGGAVMIEGSAVFRKCTFVDQLAGFGGAIHAQNASIHLMGCYLGGNTVYYSGGAIRAVDSTIIISRCTVGFNAADRAGAIDARNSTVRVSQSMIRANYAYLESGGISSTGLLDIRGTRLLSNELTNSGGGAIASVGTLKLSECLLAGNSSGVGGSAAYAPEGSVTIRGCTIASNGAGSSAGPLWLHGAAVVANSILWGNSSQQIAGNPVVRFSIVEGGYVGVGNKNTDPKFAGGQFRLGPGSPCIDSGSNLQVTLGTTQDLDGKPRFRNDPWSPNTGVGPAPVVDIGAYEFVGSSCPPDCNADGTLNASDLACFDAKFQQAHPYGDYNKDGLFNSADYAAFNAAFSAGCP